MTRLRELDFLRGIAILLVLFRHQYLFKWTQFIGWAGVDLFFVLSGFLVSGLLFKEYLKFGNIHIKRFLIRRGFKIYPVYYLFSFFYVIPKINMGTINPSKLAVDLVFLQNYLLGWGYAFPASWSLAVEEHFYFGFALFISMALSSGKITFKKNDSLQTNVSRFEKNIFVLMVVCLLLRLYNNTFLPEEIDRNFTMTHLRIDSLLAGVLISYLYYFRFNLISHFYKSNKPVLLFIAFAGISWIPFVDISSSFFARTIGFSLAYVSFGILLLYFMLTPDINLKLNKLFSKPLVYLISKIGFCSYSIYVVHLLVLKQLPRILMNHGFHFSFYINFLLFFSAYIIAGMFTTFFIEHFFLKIRDHYFPSRS